MSPFLWQNYILWFYLLAGLGAGASQSRSRSQLIKKKQELEPELVPLGKKSGAEADKKLAGSSDLREDKKHKKIVL